MDGLDRNSQYGDTNDKRDSFGAAMVYKEVEANLMESRPSNMFPTKVRIATDVDGSSPDFRYSAKIDVIPTDSRHPLASKFDSEKFCTARIVIRCGLEQLAASRYYLCQREDPEAEKKEWKKQVHSFLSSIMPERCFAHKDFTPEPNERYTLNLFVFPKAGVGAF